VLDGSAADRAFSDLDGVRDAIEQGHFAEAALRIELLEQDVAGRDGAVVDIWARLLAGERARIEHLSGTSRPA
jgi:hypothetical protein